MGALPILYAATQELPGASYTGPGGCQGMRGYPAAAGRSAAASDGDTAVAMAAPPPPRRSETSTLATARTRA